MPKVQPTMSVMLSSNRKNSNGQPLPIKVSLTGNKLHLRGGMLNDIQVDLDELKEAISMLEKYSQEAAS